MSMEACYFNQLVACEAATNLLDGGGSVFTLQEHEVNRMLVCGSCPNYSFSKEDSKTAFRNGMETLLSKISRFDEWGADPEVSKVKSQERGKAWRETNREAITDRNEDRRIESRISKLLNKFGGK